MFSVFPNNQNEPITEMDEQVEKLIYLRLDFQYCKLIPSNDRNMNSNNNDDV